MALKEFTEEIDGQKYKTIVFPSIRGLGLKTRVIKLVGPVVNGSSNESLDLSSFLGNLSESAVSSLAIDLLAQTWTVGEKGHIIDQEFFDEHFAGDYFHLYKVIWFVIKSNGFLGKGNIGELMASLKVKMPTILPQGLTQN
jgi:hypothetical protein